jgi:hypothetical protein
MAVGARANYAVGLDWASLHPLGRLRPSGSPTRAYVLQAAISVDLISLYMREAEGFAAMVEFTVLMSRSFWLIGSSIVALLMLRWRESVLCQLAQ